MPVLLGEKYGTASGSTELKKFNQIYLPQNQVQRTYYVLSDGPNSTESQIINTPGLPPLRSYLSGAFLKGYNLNLTDTVIHDGVVKDLWEVTCEFDNEVEFRSSGDSSHPGEDLRPEVGWTGETEEEELEKDAVTGEPVQTAAEERVIIMTPYVIPVLTIRRLENYPFDPNIMLNYSHRLNSTTFWGAPAGSALMFPMTVEETRIEGQRYVTVTYTIKFKIKAGIDEPWKARILHHGYKYREKPGAEPVVARDKYRTPITVNLNADGTKNTSETPDYLEFNRFQKVDFNLLGLGPFG